jgi:uncharacterized protein with PQ loop repeat
VTYIIQVFNDSTASGPANIIPVFSICPHTVKQVKDDCSHCISWPSSKFWESSNQWWLFHHILVKPYSTVPCLRAYWYDLCLTVLCCGICVLFLVPLAFKCILCVCVCESIDAICSICGFHRLQNEETNYLKVTLYDALILLITDCCVSF